jgi:hypothetical protein
MITTADMPPIKTNGDLWIVRQLEQVRQVAGLLGQLPAFRRGRMYFDFETDKVRVAQEGGAAC